MALLINDNCLNCGYCAKECPNNAIYEPGMQWAISDGTDYKGLFISKSGKFIDAEVWQPPLSAKYYFIIPEKCAECYGLFDEPQCRVVCPDPESIVPDESYTETTSQLLRKQNLLNKPGTMINLK